MESIGDQREADEADEHDVEFVESREDAAESFEATEQPLHLVASLVHLTVVLPGIEPGLGCRHHRDEPEIKRELASLVAGIGAVDQQMKGSIGRTQAGQRLSAHWAVVGLPGRQRERYGRASIRGNPMNLGGPTASGLADGLRTVFFASSEQLPPTRTRHAHRSALADAADPASECV